jgi:hypothetical protein
MPCTSVGEKKNQRINAQVISNTSMQVDFPSTVFRVIHIIRFKRLTMTDQTPSQEPTGQDRNPEQNGLQQLQDIKTNMERGFDLVWQQLAEITTQLSTVPTRTVEIFSSQSGFTEGHGGTKSRVSSVG